MCQRKQRSSFIREASLPLPLSQVRHLDLDQFPERGVGILDEDLAEYARRLLFASQKGEGSRLPHPRLGPKFAGRESGGLSVGYLGAFDVSPGLARLRESFAAV